MLQPQTSSTNAERGCLHKRGRATENRGPGAGMALFATPTNFLTRTPPHLFRVVAHIPVWPPNRQVWPPPSIVCTSRGAGAKGVRVGLQGSWRQSHNQHYGPRSGLCCTKSRRRTQARGGGGWPPLVWVMPMRQWCALSIVTDPHTNERSTWTVCWRELVTGRNEHTQNWWGFEEEPVLFSWALREPHVHGNHIVQESFGKGTLQTGNCTCEKTGRTSVANEVGRHSGLRHGQGCGHNLVESEHCAWRGWRHTSNARGGKGATSLLAWSPEQGLAHAHTVLTLEITEFLLSSSVKKKTSLTFPTGTVPNVDLLPSWLLLTV